MASSERSAKRPTRPTASRSRRKAVAAIPTPAEDLAPASLEEPVTLASPRQNVAPLEGALSMVVGVLLVVAALFPRSIRQLLMLGIGGGLVVRGMAGRGGAVQEPRH